MQAAEIDDLKAESLSQSGPAEAFMERVCDIVNAGAQSVMISIGHRAGLFDAMAGLEPASSRQIADRTCLSERYVREWLATMVTANIIDYAPQNRTYHLPPAHAACLTREAEHGNLAVYAQHISLLGAMQENTLRCLETGEGTSYDDYPCFHQVMAEDSEQTVVNALFENVLPLAEGIESRLVDGIEVLDAGCGEGRALVALAKRYPRSRFTGYDLCEDAIVTAARHAESEKLDNLRFATRDLSDFDESGRYDLVLTLDAIHDQRDPEDFIARLHRALKSSGVYLMQDIGGSEQLENNLDFPMASLFYAISLSHCTQVSIGQGGKGLGAMWGWETAQVMLKKAGFISSDPHWLPHDPTNVWFVNRRQEYDD